MTEKEITDGIKLLCETSTEVQGFYLNDENIVEALNSANPEDLKRCSEYYSSRKGVVVDIRKELINRLIQKEIFTVKSLHKLIAKYKKGKENQFRSYKETFSIVFPVITFYGHNTQRDFIESFTSKLINDLSIADYVKEVSFDFQGVRQQGSDRYWVAIYNKKQENQSKGIQFFFEFYKGKIGYGVYKHENKSYLKPRENSTPDEFNYQEMLSYFNDSKKILLEDIPEKVDLPSNSTDAKVKISKMKFPLNTILYGPPGTGKTYNTILRAAEIIENRKIESYDEALKIFKTNLHDRIEFITFHQNYSYEDFIQGLRPDTKEETERLLFKKSDGIFKKIADRALKNYKESEKAPEEISKEKSFREALDSFIDELNDNEGVFKITDNCQVFEVEEDAFRYTGDNWTRHSNGIRMKFNDLIEFYVNNVKSRKEIKLLENVSGLAKQHSTYYFGVYQEILKHIRNVKINPREKKPKQNYVIVIDEINRANISRVFGELITLIEPDKRSHGAISLEARLPSGDLFVVPSNLYIIGTMNTADKSIALLDIALRRRFEFESMYPLYRIEGQEIYDVEILEKINKQIVKSKGHDFQIGHAYFMGDNKNLIERMNKKVIPLLLEYYMNDEKEVKGILQLSGLKIIEDSWPLRISGKND